MIRHSLTDDSESASSVDDAKRRGKRGRIFRSLEEFENAGVERYLQAKHEEERTDQSDLILQR